MRMKKRGRRLRNSVIRSQKIFIERYQRRSGIVNAFNRANEIFSYHDEETIEEVMSKGIWPIADALDLDQLCLYRFINDEGGIQYGQRYRWNRQEGGTAPLIQSLVKLPDKGAVRDWLSILNKNQCINIRVSDLPPDEYNFFSKYDVKSIYFVPIFTYSEFWGFISLEDHRTSRYFIDEDEDLMRMGARFCANALIRSDRTEAAERATAVIRYKERMADTLNKAAIICLSKNEGSFEELMSASVKLIADHLDIDRMSVWRNFTKPDGLHASQIFRWSYREGGITNPTEGLHDILYASGAASWESRLAEGKTINGIAADMPEYWLFEKYGMVSLFVAPVHINHRVWVYVIFEDLQKPRVFDNECVDILSQAAFLYANVIIGYEMERDVESSNTLNRVMLDVTPMGIGFFNALGEIIDCNKSLARMFNCDKDYLREHFYDMLPEFQPDGKNSKEQARVNIRAALSGEGAPHFEFNHLTAQGELLPCDVTLKRVNYNGQIMGIGYMYDLRNTKKMEMIASRAQKMADALKDASPISYILFDDSTEPIDCNDAALKLFKAPSKEYLLKNYWSVFSPEYQANAEKSREEAVRRREQAIRQGVSVFEWMHTDINGELIPMENTMTRVLLDGTTHVISYKYDMRNIKRMNEDLRRQGLLLSERLEQQELMSDIARSFIANEGVDGLIESALGKIGCFLKASRVIIASCNREKENTIIEWTWNDEGAPLPSSDTYAPLPLILEDFADELPEGIAAPTVICDKDSCESQLRRDAMEKLNVSSLLCAALYMDGKLWGTLHVEQCDRAREWTASERSFVSMIASTISGAI
ncbi:MAG: GAF domain-containing protein, partial [Clostridiales bacterium]|nr:GAF domain-containing protein [Clostridiales bacterium]